MEKKLRDSRYVAEWIDTTPGTLAYWRYMGKGPKFLKLGRSVRYRDEDVETWLAERTRERTGEPASA